MKLQIAIDCSDPHTQARFWGAALHYDVASDPDFIQGLLDQGVASDDDVMRFEGELVWRDGAACDDPDGERPRLYFQRVAEPKTVKNRVHLDIHLGPEAGPDHREQEVARLEALGATRLYEGQQGPNSWVTMQDPEGNEFCLS